MLGEVIITKHVILVNKQYIYNENLKSCQAFIWEKLCQQTKPCSSFSASFKYLKHTFRSAVKSEWEMNVSKGNRMLHSLMQQTIYVAIM